MKKLFTLSFLAFLFSCYYDVEDEIYPTTDVEWIPGTASYSQHVEPILTANCTGCHNSGFPEINFSGYINVKAFMDGTTRGFPSTEIFLCAVKQSGCNSTSAMPPNGGSLGDKVIILEDWINQGYPDN